MPAIVYLDPEDEITSAATRIRQAPDTRVALVVPFGSRVATSRINFRLLAREAMVNGRRLDIVAPDAAARALAASAGIPVFASVGEYESALMGPQAPAAGSGTPDRDRAVPAGSGLAAAAAASAAASASVREDPPAAPHPAGAVGGFAPSPRSSAATRRPDAATQAELDAVVQRSREVPAGRQRRRGPGAGMLAAVLLLVFALVSAGVAGYVFLPTATITLTPQIGTVGPVRITVHADPEATAVDTKALVIPAQPVEIPVEASGDFQATGKRVEKTPATGAVRWTNCDPTASYSIPKGTTVRTADGTAFGIDETIFLPVAIISGGGSTPTLKCQTSDVAVTAVVAGLAGNVMAGAIHVVPGRYNHTVIRAVNLAATTGGTETTFTRISKKDVETALATLGADLTASFETEVGNPARVPPGTTAFPETAVLGDPVTDPDPAGLVNQEVESFTLSMSATGTMLVVDPSPVAGLAAAQLTAAVTPGSEMIDGSTRVSVGEGSIADGVITFAASAVAKEVLPVDAAALERQVLGLSADKAREDVLAAYGEVSIVLWPDWVTTIPTLDQRVTFTVADPVDPGAPAGPDASASATP
ncbi:MAG: baseplate J/gp47 family protein [Chloroflexota bacterium]